MPDGPGLHAFWATDGSSNSAHAIPLLRQMVLPVASGLTILTVAPHAFLSPARPDPGFLTRVTRASKQKALLEARQAAERDATALDPSVPVEVLSRWGHPVEEILRASTQLKADIIVMAAKGHSNLRIAMLGSVTQGVAQSTTRPLLIARPGADAVRRVLLGYHGTTAAKKAFAFLNRLALPSDAEIVLTTVIEPVTFPEGTPAGFKREALRQAQEVAESRETEARIALDDLAKRIAALGRRVSTAVAGGAAAESLDAAAREHGAGLIVVGSARPKPQGHFLLGATAEKLVRHAHVSVLVVK